MVRSTLLWKEVLKDRTSRPTSVNDVIFSPDSSQLLVAAGKQIHIFSVFDAKVIQSLNNHRDLVTCLSYSRDGKRFASGSVDRQVIIWDYLFNGLLKFTHSDGIRCMHFNPVTNQLASCTSRDFGFWSPDMKQVPKFSVPGCVIDCSWSSDGHHLALALSLGYVSIRSRSGDEVSRIERVNTPPVLSVSFSPTRDSDDLDFLALVDRSQTLCFYDLSGKQVGKEKNLGYDALSVEFSPSGETLLISGSNRKTSLYTMDGVLINSICELESWVKCSCPDSSGKNLVAVGSENGEVAIYELFSSVVHSLYKEHYAYRNSMTDVIIQHLISDEKVRIKCRDLVKTLAVYKNRLAIQLPEKIVIYELVSDVVSSNRPASSSPERASGMHYKVSNKINQKDADSCTLLVVGTSSVILNEGQRLQCVNFEGVIEREWIIESFIRYVKATGGPSGKEGVLMGLRNGQILQIFMNNPFPILIVQLKSAIRCLDLSMRRKRLAVVDDRGICSVFDTRSKQLLFQANFDGNVNSVSFNSQVEDMLSFSGSGNLIVKMDNHVVYQQPLQGFVVGFAGAKVFCLQQNTVSTIEISETITIVKFIEDNRFLDSYCAACLKASHQDWEYLAHKALDALQLHVAKKAFSHLNDYLYLGLIKSFEDSNDTSKESQLSFMGEVAASRGNYSQAVMFYRQAGRNEKALNMLTDLKMFDQAQDLVRSGDSKFKKQLALKQAEWVKNINEPKAAAEMYLTAGEYKEAIDIIGQQGWIDMLLSVVQLLSKEDKENLAKCAEYLAKHKQYFHAADVYKKIGDTKSLTLVYVAGGQWKEAFACVDQFPDVRQEVYSKYANFLAEQEKFTEAQAAFHAAGMTREALAVLQTLTSNAIYEQRFSDAGYYSWILSHQCLDLLAEEMKRIQGKELREQQRESSVRRQQSFLERYHKFQSMADLYFAYERIYKFIEEPFTTYFPDVIFNTARFLYHSTVIGSVGDDDVPPGISRVVILYGLVKQCGHLGAFKLARSAYEKLQSLYIPPRFLPSIEMGDLTIRAKPFNDAEDLLPLCYRCSTTNPLSNPKGNQCINCQQEFIFSFGTFDVLPVVRFEIEDGISDEEAIELIQTPVQDSSQRIGSGRRQNKSIQRKREKWEEERNATVQSLKIRDDNPYDGSENGEDDALPDPFTIEMSSLESLEGRRVVADRDILLSLRSNEVFIASRPDPLRKVFFKNLLPDMSIIMCSTCHRFFLEDETLILQDDSCPFCRNSMQTKSDMTSGI